LSFLYQAFGLNIHAQFECPELTPNTTDTVADIFFREGFVAEHLENASIIGEWVEVLPQLVLLHIDQVGRFLVENGKTITVYPHKETSREMIRLFLLGSAMGALLYQRGILPFHGSSVNKDGQSMVFSGPSGIGKSTLAASMMKKGFQLLSDDVTAITFSPDGIPETSPGIPQIKLCRDSIQQLEFDVNRGRMLGQSGKIGFSPYNQVASHTFPLQAIYILGRHPKKQTEVVPLYGIDKFHALRMNTYRPLFVKAMGIEQEHFDQLKKLASGTDVYLILRPENGFHLDEIVAKIEKSMIE
jgi:hypothetical protein